MQGRSSAGQKALSGFAPSWWGGRGEGAALTSWLGIWRGLTMQGRWWGDAGKCDLLHLPGPGWCALRKGVDPA